MNKVKFQIGTSFPVPDRHTECFSVNLPFKQWVPRIRDALESTDRLACCVHENPRQILRRLIHGHGLLSMATRSLNVDD